MLECLFNSWGYRHRGSRPDELLCLFAQLILMSAMAIQIRAYGPLSSQDGGQPQLVALACMRLCISAGSLRKELVYLVLRRFIFEELVEILG